MENEIKESSADSSRQSVVAKFAIGKIVRHRHYSFRGIIFNVDAQFSGDKEWLNAIEEDIRPDPDQPFYHLIAESGSSEYIAYVSEQNLVADDEGSPLKMPDNVHLFEKNATGQYRLRFRFLN